jgi:inhibitor of cysteine peptidase
LREDFFQIIIVAMAAVTLTNANNGESIEVRQGDEIVLRLPENPTTGYRWHVDRADGIVEQEIAQQEVTPPPSDPNTQFGRGGVREFRFRAQVPGSGRLELKHWREWEGEGSVTKRFAVDIIVTS